MWAGVVLLVALWLTVGIMAVKRWSRPVAVNVRKQVEPQEAQPAAVKLTTIYRHTARLSEAMLVKDGDPLPAGWEGGDGWRTMRYHEQPRWEASMSSMLSGGKEGDRSEIRH